MKFKQNKTTSATYIAKNTKNKNNKKNKKINAKNGKIHQLQNHLLKKLYFDKVHYTYKSIKVTLD